MRQLLLALAPIVLLAPVAQGQSDPVQRPVRTPTVRPRPAAPATVVATVAAPATPTTPGVIVVSWDPVPGATAYDVGFSAPPDGWRRITRVQAGTTRLTHPGRPAMTPHTYQVITVADDLASLPARSAEVVVPMAPAGDPMPRPSTGDTASTPTPADTASPTTPTTTTSTTTQPPTIPTIAPGDSTVCVGGYTGGRVLCTSAEWRFASTLSGNVPVKVSCPARHWVVSGGWTGVFDRGAITTSRPSHVSGWEAVLTLPMPSVTPARSEYSLRAWVLCTPD